MKTRDRYLSALAALGLCLFLTAGDAAARDRTMFTEVVVEVGGVSPEGDLGASYDTPQGFGADIGFEVGVRVRQRMRNGWAISPSFHYGEFGNYSGSNTDIGLFEAKASTYRYGVDLQYFFPARRGSPRLFLTGGGALVRNRYREDYLDDGSYFTEGVNTLVMSGGIGLEIGDFEISAQYHRDRFDTVRFFDGVTDYDWDYISFRVGFALPQSY